MQVLNGDFFMRTLFSTVGFLFLSISTAYAGNLDTQASSLGWLGNKLTGKHFGKLTFKDGNIIEKDGKWTGGEFTVDMTSMTVEDIKGDGAKKLLGHLKSGDFFQVDKFSTASLKINSVSGNTVNASLTIKGKTNPVRFTYKKEGKAFVGKMIFDRTKYDIKYRSKSFFPNIGDKVIMNEVGVDFKVQSK